MSVYAAYAFDEGSGSTIHDYSGNGRNMTVTGTNSWPTGHGSYANAFQSGTTIASDGAHYTPGGSISALSGDLTVQLWFKYTGGLPAGTDDVHAGGLYEGGGTGRVACWAYRNLGATAGSPEFTVRDSTGAIISVGDNGHVADGNWHNAACVYHSSGLIEVYLDGTQVYSSSPTANPQGNNVTDIAVGANWSGTNTQAVVQDMRIFDQALTSTEVNTWMNTPVHASTGAVTLKKMSVAASNSATVVQFKDLSSATSGNFDANVTIHNSVFVVVTTYNPSNVAIGTSAVTAAGQTLVKLMELSTPYNGQLQYFSIWGAADSPGGSSAVSATVSNGTFNPGDGLLCFEVAGLGTTWLVDKTVSASSGTGTAVASGSTAAITKAGEFVLAALVSANGTTGTPTGLTSGVWNANGGIYAYNWAGYSTPTDSGGTYSASGTETSAGPWAAGVVTITPGPRVIGTSSVTMKKMSVLASNPHFNVGASGDAASIAHTGNAQVTIPSGVNEGDLLVVTCNVFTWTDNPNPVIHLTPAVGSWTQIDVQQDCPPMSALTTHGSVWVRQAGPADAGSTLTFTATADSYGTDQFWLTAVVASYFSLDASHIVAAGTSGLNTASSSIATPSVVTDTDGMWGIYCGPITPNSSGAISSGPSGTTVRENLFNAGADCAIADTNGTVGTVGTTVGGTGKTWTIGSSSAWWTSFTLVVAQTVANVPNTGKVTVKKMKAAGVGNVTGTFTVVYNSSSGGVDSYDVTSPVNNSGSHTMRVIVPTNPDPAYPHSFLYMFPVEPAGSSTFGDPISNATNLGLANTYNTTIIVPGYDIDPWYGDNPNDATIHQETFTIWVTQWVAANLFITGSEKHYLTGFSKSGIGGADLIFRHPTVFEKAALWDTPADDNAYNRFSPSDSAVYGTAANFTDYYQLSSANLADWSGPFTATNRLWIAQGSSYGTEVADWHALMTSIGILHSYDATSFTGDSHAWHDDWIIAGLSSIFSQVPSVHVTPKKMSVAASGSSTSSGDSGTVAITLKKMTAASSGGVSDQSTATVTLQKMTVSGTATAPLVGTAAVTIRKTTVFGSGKATLSGAINVTLKKVAVSGSGLSPIFGTVDITMLKMKVSASDGHVVQASSLFIFMQP